MNKLFTWLFCTKIALQACVKTKVFSVIKLKFVAGAASLSSPPFPLLCSQLFQHPARMWSNRMKSFQLIASVISAGGTRAYFPFHAASPDATDAAVTKKPPTCLEATITIGILRFYIHAVLF
jgi:hypothetical protein